MVGYETIGSGKRIRIPKYITEPKKIETSINRAKDWLVSLAEKYGNYENFGRTTVMEISDRYINISSYTPEMNYDRQQLKRFDEWCSTYSKYDSIIHNGTKYNRYF